VSVSDTKHKGAKPALPPGTGTRPKTQGQGRGGASDWLKALLSCFYSNAALLCFRSDSSCSRRFAIELSAGLSCNELRSWICSRGPGQWAMGMMGNTQCIHHPDTSIHSIGIPYSIQRLHIRQR
jgi:hypothetical protein